jgi:uncharacterized membrane protein HdeD (DUF308 family)
LLLVLGDWRSVAVRGVAAALFGILTLLWPEVTLTVLVVLFGVFALVDGVTALAAAFRDRSADQPRRLLVLTGALGVTAGIITIVWPDITAVALLAIIAAWAMILGLLELTVAFRARHRSRVAWLFGLAGALSVALAIALLVDPGAGALAITWAIGWYALLDGAVMLWLAWRLRMVERGEVAAGPPYRSHSTPHPA